MYPFSNEDEISSLGKKDINGSAALVSSWVDELIVTKGAAGASIFADKKRVNVSAMPYGGHRYHRCG